MSCENCYFKHDCEPSSVDPVTHCNEHMDESRECPKCKTVMEADYYDNYNTNTDYFFGCSNCGHNEENEKIN